MANLRESIMQVSKIYMYPVSSLFVSDHLINIAEGSRKHGKSMERYDAAGLGTQLKILDINFYLKSKYGTAGLGDTIFMSHTYTMAHITSSETPPLPTLNTTIQKNQSDR